MPHAHPLVLLIDDHDDARDGMAQLLLQEGYRVETARGGREALRILRTVHPCIILLDLMMPDMSGYDFRQAQLADDDLKDIPVVIYSAAYDIVEQTKQLGAAGFAQKPIEIGRLMEMVRQHCLK